MNTDCTNDSYTIQPDFIAACKLANTPPTKRQASRFRMGKGRAYNASKTIHRAPSVPDWFDAEMGSDTCPQEIKFDITPPGPENTPEETAAHESAALEKMQEIETRNREISEWKTRYQNRRREQWPKFWTLKTLGLV